MLIGGNKALGLSVLGCLDEAFGHNGPLTSLNRIGNALRRDSFIERRFRILWSGHCFYPSWQFAANTLWCCHGHGTRINKSKCVHRQH